MAPGELHLDGTHSGGRLVMREPELSPFGAARDITLLDLVDRILAGGITVSGELVLSVAGVDLVVIELRALLASVSTAFAAGVVPISQLPKSTGDSSQEQLDAGSRP